APGHLGRGGPRHLGPPGPGDPLLVHARAPGRRRLLDGRRRPAVGRSPPGPVAVPRHRRAAAEAPQARLRHRPLTGKCPADRPEQHFPERKGRAPKAPPRRPGGRWGAEPPNCYLAVAASRLMRPRQVWLLASQPTPFLAVSSNRCTAPCWL